MSKCVYCGFEPKIWEEPCPNRPSNCSIAGLQHTTYPLGQDVTFAHPFVKKAIAKEKKKLKDKVMAIIKDMQIDKSSPMQEPRMLIDAQELKRKLEEL